MKQWFLNHWTSGSEGQSSLKMGNKQDEPYDYINLVHREGFQVIVQGRQNQVEPYRLLELRR